MKELTVKDLIKMLKGVPDDYKVEITDGNKFVSAFSVTNVPHKESIIICKQIFK